MTTQTMFVRKNWTQDNAEDGEFPETTLAKRRFKNSGSYSSSRNSDLSLYSCPKSNFSPRGKLRHVWKTFPASRLSTAPDVSFDLASPELDHVEITEAQDSFLWTSKRWNMEMSVLSDSESVPPYIERRGSM